MFLKKHIAPKTNKSFYIGAGESFWLELCAELPAAGLCHRRADHGGVAPRQVRKFDRLVAVNGHTSEKSKDSWPVSGGLHEAGEAFGALTGSQVRLLGAKPAALGRVGLCQPTKSPPKHSNMSRHACSLGISW